MRTALVLIMVAAMAAPTLAGDSPEVRLYIDFDPPNYQYRFDTTVPYETVHAFLMSDCIPGGSTGVSCEVSITPGLSIMSSYALRAGMLEDTPGALITSGGVTLAGTCSLDDPQWLADITLLVASAATTGEITITNSSVYPREHTDCHQPFATVDMYCVLSHGGVNMDPTASGEDCPCNSPVEESSWGTIKAMYR